MILCTAFSDWEQNYQFANKWLPNLSQYNVVYSLQTFNYNIKTDAGWQPCILFYYIPLPKLLHLNLTML